MAKYDKGKFFWLQLKEDFFDEDAIDWLEEQPNGKEYSLFYLKLCLKSLRTNGILIRKVGTMLVPYDHIKLGELTKTNPDTVLIAMNLLLQIGLVKKLENGELFLTQISEMIGSQSKSAFKKQQQRLVKNNEGWTQGGHRVDNCPPNKEIELELDLDKKKNNLSKSKYGQKNCIEIDTNENILTDCNATNDLKNEFETIFANEKAEELEVVDPKETMFNEFWKLYPKKVNKKGAKTSFMRIKGLKKEFDNIMLALKKCVESKDWQKQNGQFIPHPQTWINQERWKDKNENSEQEVIDNWLNE